MRERTVLHPRLQMLWSSVGGKVPSVEDAQQGLLVLSPRRMIVAHLVSNEGAIERLYGWWYVLYAVWLAFYLHCS